MLLVSMQQLSNNLTEQSYYDIVYFFLCTIYDMNMIAHPFSAFSNFDYLWL